MGNLLGEKVMAARKAANFSQQAVAKKTGLSRSYICDIENGRYRPSIKALVKIASVIKLDLNFLSEMTEIQDDAGEEANTVATGPSLSE